MAPSTTGIFWQRVDNIPQAHWLNPTTGSIGTFRHLQRRYRVLHILHSHRPLARGA
jgi:hypothetical protein